MKLITQKPWQADTRLTVGALSVGRFVAVHVRKDDPSVADWVQIATDKPSVARLETWRLPTNTWALRSSEAVTYRRLVLGLRTPGTSR